MRLSFGPSAQAPETPPDLSIKSAREQDRNVDDETRRLTEQAQGEIGRLRDLHGWTGIDLGSVQRTLAEVAAVPNSMWGEEELALGAASPRYFLSMDFGSSTPGTVQDSEGRMQLRFNVTSTAETADSGLQTKIYQSESRPVYDLHDTLADSFATQALRLGREQGYRQTDSDRDSWRSATEACLQEIYDIPIHALLNRRSVLQHAWNTDGAFPGRGTGMKITCDISAEYNPTHRALRYTLETLESRLSSSYDTGSALQQLTHGTPQFIMNGTDPIVLDHTPVISSFSTPRWVRCRPRSRDDGESHASRKCAWEIDTNHLSFPVGTNVLPDPGAMDLDILWDNDRDFATLMEEVNLIISGQRDRGRPVSPMSNELDLDELEQFWQRAPLSSEGCFD